MSSVRSVAPFLRCLTAALALTAACSGQSMYDPDHNDTAQTAGKLKNAFEYSLDVGKGDKEDWYFIFPEKSGKLTLTITVGPFGDNATIAGEVTVFSGASAEMTKLPIAPGGNQALTMSFQVEANSKYYVRFKALSGKGKYSVVAGEPEDACSACDPQKQECFEGKCRDKPCGGDCGDNETCDKVKNVCVKVKAKSDDRPRPKREASHEVKCGANEVEKNGECVPKGGDAVECDIHQVLPEVGGSGSRLILRCGKSKEIAVGMSGTVKGVKGASFTINAVWPARSQAHCGLPEGKLQGATSVTIKK